MDRKDLVAAVMSLIDRPLKPPAAVVRPIESDDDPPSVYQLPPYTACPSGRVVQSWASTADRVGRT